MTVPSGLLRDSAAPGADPTSTAQFARGGALRAAHVPALQRLPEAGGVDDRGVGMEEAGALEFAQEFARAASAPRQTDDSPLAPTVKIKTQQRSAEFAPKRSKLKRPTHGLWPLHIRGDYKATIQTKMENAIFICRLLKKF